MPWDFTKSHTPGFSWALLLGFSTLLSAEHVARQSKVRQGREAKDPEAIFVGMFFPKGKGNSGTGTLLCSNVVITAGHVANPVEEAGHQGLMFVLGAKAGERARQIRRDQFTDTRNARFVKEVFSLNPAIRSAPAHLEDTATDISLVRLDKPFRKEDFPEGFPKLSSNVPKKTARLTVVGYGRESEGGASGTRRAGELQAQTILRNDKGDATLVTGPGPTGTLPLAGDSGAPIFASEDAGKLGTLAAIHSSKDSKDSEKSYEALVHVHRDTILTKLKQWCPPGEI